MTGARPDPARLDAERALSPSRRRQPDDASAARFGEAGCRAGRKLEPLECDGVEHLAVLHGVDSSPGFSVTRSHLNGLSLGAASAVIHGCDRLQDIGGSVQAGPSWRHSTGLRSAATHRNGRFKCSTVGVAQLVELLVVVQAVGGSSPLAHPPKFLVIADYQSCGA